MFSSYARPAERACGLHRRESKRLVKAKLAVICHLVQATLVYLHLGPNSRTWKCTTNRSMRLHSSNTYFENRRIYDAPGVP